MVEEKIINRYSGLVQKYQDRFLLDDLVSNLDALLFSIYLIDEENKKTGTKRKEVRNFFISVGRTNNNFNAAVYEAKKQNLIRDTDKKLFLLIKGLKRIRRLLGQIEKYPVHIIKSGKNFTAIKLFEEFLSTEIKHDEILICDSYISPATLFPFSILNGKIKSIKILTSSIYEQDKLKDYIKRMQKEMRISVEVKLNRKIHERFLICGDKCWHIGASIKDLGNKDTIIREISEVIESLKTLFLERFNEN